MDAHTSLSQTGNPIENIAHEIRFRLQPKAGYYDFVHRHIFNGVDKLKGVDPFNIESPQYSPQVLYHDRQDVSETINHAGSMIIYGKLGCGKTMLFGSRQQKKGQLLTLISLPHIRDLATFQPDSAPAVSPLNPWTLAYLIFNTFWSDFIVSPAHRDNLDKVKNNQPWMEMLRWFYHHFPPFPFQIPDTLDFAVKAWLQSSLPEDRIPATFVRDHILEQLVKFVTFSSDDPIRNGGNPLYERITVLVDGVDSLSGENQNKLEQEIGHILELSLSKLEIKVFLNSSDIKLFFPERKYAFYPSNLSFYELPQWSEDDLKCLLYARINAYDPSLLKPVTHGKSGECEVDLPVFSQDAHFSRDIRGSFFQRVIKEARRCYEKEDPCEAPIHLLRLVRGCLAYAAGQWPDSNKKTQFTVKNLVELADAYWAIE